MEFQSTEKFIGSPKKTYRPRFGLAIFAAVLGMFQFGYNTTVINAPENVMKNFYNESQESRFGRPMSDGTLTFLWAFTVAITAVGGCIGGLLGAPWSEKLGRKKGMLVNTVIGLVGAVLMACSYFARSYEMLIVGRFVIGLHCGLNTGLAPLYNAEVAPPAIRGAIGTINQLAVTVGLLIAQVLGLSEILGTERWWPLLLGLSGVAPILQLIILPFCPESPRYLLLSRNEKEAAVSVFYTCMMADCMTAITGSLISSVCHHDAALQQLHGRDDVSQELEEMNKEKEQSEDDESNEVNMCTLCSVSSLRLPVAVAVIMHLSQQLSGINVIFYYSVNLFTNVGLDQNTAKYASLAVGGIMVVMTLVSIPLMDRVGRRTLHLIGLGGIIVFSIVFTVCYHFALRPESASEALRITSIVSALIFVVFFALGPGSIPWMIVAEFFSQGPRPAAVSIGVLVNWLANFAVGLSFPPLQGALKELVFVPFTCLTAIFFIFLIIFLPETKGKTFEEISALFSKKSGGSKKDLEPYKQSSENSSTVTPM